MEVGLENVNLALAALAAGAATLLAFAALVFHAARRPLSEAIIVAVAGFVLLTNVEVYGISAWPGPRPLRHLPAVHTAITIALLLYLQIRYGIAGWQALGRAFWTGLDSGRFPLFTKLCVAVAGLAALGLLIAGAYLVPATWDPLAYHIPMAIQPYQDGRVGAVLSDLPWARTYPRGVPLMWTWTLLWTHSDLLFNPALLLMGLQFAVAAYALARRMGVQRWAAALGLPVLITMPIFWVLCTTGYVDLAPAGAVLSTLVFLAPQRGREPARLPDWLLAVIPAGQALLVKMPLLLVALVGVVAIGRLLCGRWGVLWNDVRRFAWSVRGVFALLVVVLASHTYIENLVQYGNPFYPIRLGAGVEDGKRGVVGTAGFGMGAATRAPKPVAHMNMWEKYYYSWTDFVEPANPDSFGSFGPILPYGLLLPAAASVIAAVTTWKRWSLTYVALIALCLPTPAFLPRYGLVLVALLVVGALQTISHIRGRAAVGYALIVLGLTWSGIRPPETQVEGTIEWLCKVNGGSLPLAQRSGVVLETFGAGGRPYYPSARMVREIRERSQAGDTLAWNVSCFHTLLWNRTYSNRVVYLPGAPREGWPSDPLRAKPPTDAELAEWVRKLQALAPRHVLVYGKGRYAARLRDEPGLGYVAVYEDAPGGHPMVLFERRSSVTSSRPVEVSGEPLGS